MGTIGVSYYQFDNDLSGITTVHLVHCHGSSQDCASASSWNANGAASLGGPFAMDTAPFANGFFVGDYEALTDFDAHGFRPFFIMAKPAATKGATDPFSNTACPTGGC